MINLPRRRIRKSYYSSSPPAHDAAAAALRPPSLAMVPQPSGNWTLDRNNPLVDKLLFATYFTADDVAQPFDYVSNRRATTVTSVTTDGEFGPSRGIVPSFNGTTSKVLFDLNLGGKKQVSLVFWMYWDANVVGANHVALSYGADLFANNGFLVSPNATTVATGNYTWYVGSPGVCFAATWGSFYPAGEWHHYVISFDRDNGVKGTGLNYVDGHQFPGDTANRTFATGTAFGANGGLALMHYRTIQSPPLNPGAGKLQCLSIFDGQLSSYEVTELFSNTYQLIKPVDRPFFFSGAGRRQPMIWSST